MARGSTDDVRQELARLEVDAAAAEAELGALLRAAGTLRRGDGRSVLELASGTGEHAAGIAPSLPDLTWHPSDPDPLQRASIDAHRDAVGTPNLRPARDLDAAGDWSPDLPGPLAAIFCANLLHISPPEVTEGVFRNAGRHLAPGGLLILYGPFAHDGVLEGAGNLAFDANLRARDPAWGIRDLADLVPLAERAGLEWLECIGMPADNQINVFGRTATQGRAST